MSERSPLPDWKDDHPHLLIRASAGSGKTYRLSARYLMLLRLFDQPESILATTFTRKAAGEVLGRVVTWLANATTDDKALTELAEHTHHKHLSHDHCLKMLRRLTDQMHRLSISTIDGFFNRVAQSFANELDLPPEPALVDESHPSVKQLRQDAVEAMLADADLPDMVTLLRQFHHDHAARSVTEALDKIINDTYEVYREAPHREAWAKLQPTGLLDKDSLQSAIKTLEDANADLPDLKSWRDAYQKNLHAAINHDWEGFVSNGLAKKLCEGEEKYNRRAIDAPVRSAYAPLITHAKAKMIERVALQTLATYDLLSRFDTHYTDLRRRQNILLFSDLTHKLARELPALGDGLAEDIYFRLDARVTHLLLDEFQDTSLAQWDVLRPFAQEIAATADGDRSLLVVGDAKQAIYGWRGGVAELFDQIEDELNLPPDSVQSLSLSYRSSGIVLDAANKVFSRLGSNAALDKNADTAARWQRSFDDHKSAKKLPGYVTLETSAAGYNADDDDDDNSDDEPTTITHNVHEPYIAQRVKQLYERNGGAGSIGVLVSTNKAASRLIFEIGKLGLPVSGEGGGSVTDSPAVCAFLSALYMADHPGDTASVFHVLNSPLASVLGLEAMKPAHVQQIAMRIRQTLLTQGYAQTLADWTRAVASSLDQRGLTRLTQLIELADQFEPADALRPSRFVALAESQRVAEPNPAAIRVMTIHGAKGLEFDTVVLAELDRTFRDNPALLIEREHPTAPIDSVYRNVKKEVRALHDSLVNASEAQRATRLMDDLCALYVAMTRPRQALYMIVKPRKLTPKGDKLASLGLSYAAILRDALSDVEESLDGKQTLYQHGDPDWSFQGKAQPTFPPTTDQPITAVALGTSESASRRFWPTVSPSAQAGGVKRATDLLDISPDATGAKNYGTLIHAWFELVGFIDEDQQPDEATLRQLANRLLPQVDDAWIDSRIDWFKQLLNDSVATQLLARNGATDLWRERAFAVRVGKELVRGCFDRVMIYRDDGGKTERVELIDFKTDRLGPDSAAPLVDHYRPQIQTYRRVLTKLLSVDADAIHARLWFVGDDVLADVDG